MLLLCSTTFLILELNGASTESSSWHINKCLLAEWMNNTFKCLSWAVPLSDPNSENIFSLGLLLFIAEVELGTGFIKHHLEKLNLIASSLRSPVSLYHSYHLYAPSNTHRTWRTLENDYSALLPMGDPQKLTHWIFLASIIGMLANKFPDLKYCRGISSADTLETIFHEKWNV